VHSNAPTVIAQMLGIFTLLGMLVTALFVSNALLRDFELGTAELIFASPVKRRDYLAGRIAAALATGLLFYVLVVSGSGWHRSCPGWTPSAWGRSAGRAMRWSFAVIVIPNLLFTTALLSLLAAVTRSILWVYIGLVAYLVLFGASAAVLRDIDNTWLAVLSEPLGMRAAVAHHPLLVHRRAQQRRSRPGGLPAGQPRPVAGRDGAAVRRHVRPVPHRAQRRRPSSLGPPARLPVDAAAALRPQRQPVAARGTGIQRDHRVQQFLRQVRFARGVTAQRAVHRAAVLGTGGQFPAQRAVPADPVRHLDLAGHLADDHGPAGPWLAAGDHRAVLRR
jgi:hypothetical protein